MISSFFTYLLTAALLLLGGTALYYMAFLRSTFLRWNRVLLWGILVASLGLPLVHLPVEWTIWQTAAPATSVIKPSTGAPEVGQYVPVTEIEEITLNPVYIPRPAVRTAPSTNPFYLFARLLFYCYCAGCVIFGLRFLLQVLSLLKLYRKARIEQRDGYRLVICPGELSPFAFGRSIFVSESLFQNPDLPLILTHEQAHVQQWHTLDILAAELNLIWQWFNPGAWLYRKMVERNLEYLADQNVLAHWNKKQYQMSLLNWVNNRSGNTLSTSYNFSLLKERIMMMNRKPKSHLYLLRYAVIGMLLPVLPFFNQPLPTSLAENLDSIQVAQALDAKTEATEAQALSLPKPIIAKPVPKFSAPKEKETPILPSPSSVSNQQLPLYIFIGKNPSVAELEKIAQIPLFEGMHIDFTTDKQNLLATIWLNVEGAGCGVRRQDWTNDDFFPMLAAQKKGGCRTGTLSSKDIDQLLAMSWDSIRVMGIGGFVATKETLKSIRASVVEQEELWGKNRLEELEKLNWAEESLSGATSFERSKEEQVLFVKKMLQKYNAENKPVTIKLNKVTQENLPVLEELNLKKVEVKDLVRYTYIPGTLQLKSREIIGFQVDLFTE